jgi:hypothetical protein
MARNKSHRRKMTSKSLLASTWSEVRGAEAIIHPGRSSSTRTAPFSARYRGLCERCGRWINLGDEIRYHRDFDGPVHSGCRAPEFTVAEKPVVTGRRDPTTLCLSCFLIHSGECW